MGIFSFRKQSDQELLDQRNRGLHTMQNPTIRPTETIGNLAIAGLTGLGAYLSKSWAKDLAGKGSRFAGAAKAMSTVPGAIAVGIATFVGSQLLSRYNNKLDGEIDVNAANYDLSKRVGHTLGLEPITAEDLAKMKEANGQAIGEHTAKTTAQSAATHQR